MERKNTLTSLRLIPRRCEMSDSEEEGPPQLSSYALAALQEFYAEQQQHHPDLRGDDKYNIGIIEENWVSDRAPHPSGRVGSVECVLCLVHCWSSPHLTAQFVSLVTRKLIACSVAKTLGVQIFLILTWAAWWSEGMF